MTEQSTLTTLEEYLEQNLTELRVANETPIQNLATAMVRYIEEGRHVTLSCIGAQSISQAVKAVAISHGTTAPGGKLLAIIPTFNVKDIKDKFSQQMVETTALRLIIGRIPIIL